MIKDNVGFGEWNFEQLEAEWDLEQLADWGLDVPTFEVDEETEQKDLSDEIKTGYKIEINCNSEFEQEQLYNELIERGIECRLLTL